MTGKSCITLPIAVVAVGVAWLATLGLLCWAAAGAVAAGYFGMLIGMVACVWTAVIWIRWETRRIGQGIVEAMQASIDERAPFFVEEAAVEIVRHLELRELASQVAQLVPHRPGS